MFETPHRWLFQHAERSPDAPCIDSPRARVTYAQLADRVRTLSRALVDAGLRPGERVFIALPASAAAAVAALAVQAAGATAAEVSPQLGQDALASIFDQLGARFAFVAGKDAARWNGFPQLRAFERVFVVHPQPPPARMLELLGGARCVHVTEDGQLAAAPRSAFEDRATDAEATALILFTSGSTGTPRGVLLRFRNLAANARSIAQYLELTARDRASLILPLSYAYGRSVLHAHLCAGGSVFLDDRFMYPKVVLDAATSERCTGFSGVPSTFEVLRRQLGALPPMPSLRYVTQAGGAMRPETVRWAQGAFAPAKLFVMYGQTEATARLAYLPPWAIGTKLGSIGRAIPGVVLRVVDAEGRELPDGQVGELQAFGENLSAGYLADPEATRALFADGWLRTGDLAYRDADGFFFIAGRAKEILKVAGHRVSPYEIENVIAKHAAVADVVVCGVPDEVEGEIVAAFVVPRGAEPEPSELRRFCREQLPAHMVPRVVAFLPELPRNEAGKVLRKDVRERVPQEKWHRAG